MDGTYSFEDILEQVDKLIEMMADHDEVLYGVTDMVQQVRDEVEHLVFTPDEE